MDVYQISRVLSQRVSNMRWIDKNNVLNDLSMSKPCNTFRNKASLKFVVILLIHKVLTSMFICWIDNQHYVYMHVSSADCDMQTWTLY